VLIRYSDRDFFAAPECCQPTIEEEGDANALRAIRREVAREPAGEGLGVRSRQFARRNRDLVVLFRTGVPSHAVDGREEFPLATGIEDA